MLLTTSTLPVSPNSRTMRRASSKLPSTAMVVAPYMRAWASLPRAILPLGQQDDAFHARARGVGGGGGRGVAGAGADDDLRAALLGQRHRHGHAAVLERAGRVDPSYLSHNSKSPPMALTKLSTRTSGVLPSLSETMGVLSVTGSHSAVGVNNAAPAIALFG
jgi:hypothetical protein